MNVGQIMFADTANGEGIRVSVFVSGCTIHCKGCFQPQTWDFAYGNPFTSELQENILTELEKGFYSGLTILGGEPFEPANQAGEIGLIREFKKRFPHLSLWMYTGFLYDKDLVPGGRKYTELTDEILDSVDILVEGPFVEAKRNLTLNFRGSSNQRIIDMKATRKTGSVVLSPLND